MGGVFLDVETGGRSCSREIQRTCVPYWLELVALLLVHKIYKSLWPTTNRSEFHLNVHITFEMIVKGFAKQYLEYLHEAFSIDLSF